VAGDPLRQRTLKIHSRPVPRSRRHAVVAEHIVRVRQDIKWKSGSMSHENSRQALSPMSCEIRFYGTSTTTAPHRPSFKALQSFSEWRRPRLDAYDIVADMSVRNRSWAVPIYNGRSCSAERSTVPQL
jgi:hypothetical protein